MFFKRIFSFCSLICVLWFCLIVFLCFLVLFVLLVLFMLFGAFSAFWCMRNLFVKKKIKNKDFKAALMTSFLLLLTYPRRPISTSLQGLLWITNETPSNVKSMCYVSTTCQSNIVVTPFSRSLLRFEVTLSWRPSGMSYLSIKSNTKFF